MKSYVFHSVFKLSKHFNTSMRTLQRSIISVTFFLLFEPLEQHTIQIIRVWISESFSIKCICSLRWRFNLSLRRCRRRLFDFYFFSAIVWCWLGLHKFNILHCAQVIFFFHLIRTNCVYSNFTHKFFPCPFNYFR